MIRFVGNESQRKNLCTRNFSNHTTTTFRLSKQNLRNGLQRKRRVFGRKTDPVSVMSLNSTVVGTDLPNNLRHETNQKD